MNRRRQASPGARPTPHGAFTLFARSDLGQFQTPAATFDTNLATLYLVQQTPDFAHDLNSLRIYTITGPVGSEVFTIGPTVTTTNVWNCCAPGGFNVSFLPQRGSARRILTKVANVQTLAYRNGSLWAAQTIYLPEAGAST